MSNKNLTYGMIVVGIIAIIGVFTPLVKSLKSSFGAVGGQLIEQYEPYVLYNGGINTALPFQTSSTLKVGTNGTALSNTIAASCSMIADNASIGTTTQYAYCLNVTGVTSLDGIEVTFATSSTLLSDQWIITGAKASTTIGAIDFRLLKLTGVAASQPMSAVSTIGSTTIIQAAH